MKAVINQEMLLVALVTNEVRKHCELANSQSVSYNYIRRISKEYDIFKSEYESDQYLKILFKKYELNLFMSLDDFGVDDMFICDEDEEMFEEGTYTIEDGVNISIPDDFLHVYFECFLSNVGRDYDAAVLKKKEKDYRDKELFLSNVDNDITSIEKALCEPKLSEDKIGFLYFALVELLTPVTSV